MTYGLREVIVGAGTTGNYEDASLCRHGKGSEELGNLVRQLWHKFVAIQGDKEQAQREKASSNLKQMAKFILCRSGVAFRCHGNSLLPAILDFDVPDQREEYVRTKGQTDTLIFQRFW